MKKTLLSTCTVALLALASCTDTDKSHTASQNDTAINMNTAAPADNSKTSVDWQGVYIGVIPCADCNGIENTITLKSNDSFIINSVYQGKKETLADSGKIMWHDNGNIVHLKGNTQNLQLKVGENKLIQLDQEGKVIEGALADKYIYIKK